ncbi:hypothetical protein [Rhodoferax sp.]|nr:hypothetical protein [Rhodoferax sp.]MDD2809415.1 hypothetical protein [Rhodoferax sp.]MDD4944983.1 hypothetical protein [Rhodoferax sp.]
MQTQTHNQQMDYQEHESGWSGHFLMAYFLELPTILKFHNRFLSLSE